MIIKTGREAELTIFLESLEKREIERYKALSKPYNKYKLTPEGIQELRHFIYFSDQAKARVEEGLRRARQMSATHKKKQTHLFLLALILLVMAAVSALMAALTS
ncbi:MAG TPA: hypothetical protein OIL90_12325 [Phascolarctobacterium faecium]|uniref:hypothetical protein n=1 Tax=Phascolarctobacterium faecium TaxID=33025 RepID=UPI00242BF261|nr:hypothetical protein [Phascolarctobacterium faecium]HJI10887.1 hypothetical protein [Phascolarctobacterium faecium]